MPPNNEPAKPNLNERFRSAVITLNVANAAFDIWWFYKSAETRDFNFAQKFPDFFRFDEENNFRSLIVSLYSLYDKRRDANSIKSIIRDLPANINLDISNKIDHLSGKLQKIEHLRHNVIAHRNSSASYNAIYKKAKITPNDIKHVIDNTLEILSLIALEINEPEPIISTSIKEELRLLMSQIKGE
ncbi:hypothetical protein OVA03_05235 [Asticcacaulis sp. SL142]|uniref:AbiU2 domain-containing protein n=1 Tax=Asticcacaulis sp. SL142 TaxID=2995155 RepID=UPI00226D05F9|nr:hypothetical protein [Asticcacaulis sp. SL142]WAC49314.1 hypothetical protein OVA03_05235 [Asticcacaulis sp. SL142]